MKQITIAMVVGIAMSWGVAAEELKCPKPDESGHLIFKDGSILMKTGLQVNPDGAAASYTWGPWLHLYLEWREPVA